MPRTRSQAAKYSVRKGKRLERRVVNELREWCGDHNFRRTPGSGGFNKSYDTKVGEKEFVSDVMADREIRFAIEVKGEAGFSLDSLLSAKTCSSCKFSRWWFQVVLDARRVGKLPLLWFKPRPSWDWIALDKKGFDRLALEVNYALVPMRLPVTGEVYDSDNNLVMQTVNLPDAMICRWKDIKEQCDGRLIFEEA